MPGGFKVIDANGQSLAYFYARDNDHDANTAGVLTDEPGKAVGEKLRQTANLTRQRWLSVGFGRRALLQTAGLAIAPIRFLLFGCENITGLGAERHYSQASLQILAEHPSNNHRGQAHDPDSREVTQDFGEGGRASRHQFHR